MNKLDFNMLPISIKKYIDGLEYIIDDIGKSNSLVYIFDELELHTR